MSAPPLGRFASALARMQWPRGLRAGAVILTIALACGALHVSLGWASVGGYLAIMVDSGGSYRSRLAHVATFLIGGVVASLAGTLAATSQPAAIIITALFCFAITFARVLSQPMAAASVSILVCYFVAFGSGVLPVRNVLINLTLFLSGGLWAAALILLLWPVDAFRPSRVAVAQCFRALSALAAELAVEPTEKSRRRKHNLRAELRTAIETAHHALVHTPARASTRTVRARNLTVLLEDADLLFARLVNLAELTEAMPASRRQELGNWLATSTQIIADALEHRPLNNGAAFAAEGSLTADLHRRSRLLESEPGRLTSTDAHLQAIGEDLVLTLEVAFEAVRAIWSGVEPRSTRATPLRSSLAQAALQTSAPWFGSLLDSSRAHWNADSIMLRHAVRLALVAVADVLIMRRIHVTHGFWLAMTSIIVLQPYTGHTLRRFVQRVGGTVAGGILAALLASALPSEPTLMAVVIVFAVLAAAVFTVDYGWYCFFLTPTFVLLAMPHLRDWHFAAIRMGTTVLGATIAALGMLLLGRQREARQLPLLLARGATAEAAYLRAMLTFWLTDASATPAARTTAERTVLAPARRACGMAASEAEESLDRALLEPSLHFGSRSTQPNHLHESALTFTTYLRRLTQSITALAAIGPQTKQGTEGTIAVLARRLERISTNLQSMLSTQPQLPPVSAAAQPSVFSETAQRTFAAQQLRRMERQVATLERVSDELLHP